MSDTPTTNEALPMIAAAPPIIEPSPPLDPAIPVANAEEAPASETKPSSAPSEATASTQPEPPVVHNDDAHAEPLPQQDVVLPTVPAIVAEQPSGEAPTPPAGPERTLALIKSAALGRHQRPGIMAKIEAARLQVARCAAVWLSADQVESLYAAHVGKPYWDGLRDSVTGPEGVTAMVLQGQDCVARWRALMGATDPTKAEAGTLRHLFGTEMPDNAVHGSDSRESAEREIAIVFPDMVRI